MPVVFRFLPFLSLTLFWWLGVPAEAHAGLTDSALNWILGSLFGGAAVGGAAGYQVAKRKQTVTVVTKAVPVPADPSMEVETLAPDPGTDPVDVYRVWYGTNRAQQHGKFTADLGTELRYGYCRVAVPKSHEFGSLGSGKLARTWQRMTTGTDDALYIVQRMGWPAADGANGFVRSIKHALAPERNQILVYIHGFNVSFKEAILRCAQIGFDLKVPGVAAAFSWASKGTEKAYMADEDTVRLSEAHLAEFLGVLNTNFPDSQINIIAHSMGNRILVEVLKHIRDYPALANAKFGQIFLAAPDIDARYFRTVAAVYPQLSARTTLYVCSADRALQLSGNLKANLRTGYCPPVTVVNGIDTIEATNVNLDWLGHGYYAEGRAVLYDMYLLMRGDVAPGDRPSLMQAQTDDGDPYWQLRAAPG